MARILIVDDDPDFVNLAKLYLTGKEHEVLSSKDAFEANETIDKYKVDLLLVDVNMPYTNGFDFVKSLKRTIRHRFLPVAFVTARTGKTDVTKAIELEAAGYIVKPIKKEDFIEKVEAFLNKAPQVQSNSLEVDKTSQVYEGEISLKIPVKLLSLSEMGIIMECPRELKDDDIVELKNYVFTLIGINPTPLKLLTQKYNESAKAWKSHFIFHQVSQESLQKIQMYVQSLARSGKNIK